MEKIFHFMLENLCKWDDGFFSIRILIEKMTLMRNLKLNYLTASDVNGSE